MPLFDGVGHHYSQFEENVQIAEQNTVVESDQWVVIVDSIILVRLFRWQLCRAKAD